MEDAILRVAQALKRPAGDSELFASREALLRNHAAFVEACHTTWKKLHQDSVRQLIIWEGFLQREKTHPIGGATVAIAEMNRAVWRRVNDAIVWSIFGMQRHLIKRLCLYHRRVNLLESNPNSAMSTVAKLNANPRSFALWNDATSFVDIGDVMFVEDGLLPVPQFLELKEGPVNGAIIDVLATEEGSRAQAFATFEARFGKKGVSQFNRVVRQKSAGDKAIRLMRDDHGIDPVTEHEMRVVESKAEPGSYDDCLRSMLDFTLDRREPAIECIDGCLWLYANADPAVKGGMAGVQFAELLKSKAPHVSLPMTQQNPAWDRDVIRNLSAGIKYQISKPLFLRNLSAVQVASITYGALSDKVLLYLDMDAFGKLIEKTGGNFAWGTKKDVGRIRALNPRLRPPLFGGRIPRICVGEIVAHITDPNLVEMFYDGVTPWTMAQQTVGELDEVVKSGKWGQSKFSGECGEIARSPGKQED
jgi:hypothetical protein